MKRLHKLAILFILLALAFSASGLGITHASPLFDVLPSGLNGNGPGGVGTIDGTSTLELWLRPDRGVYTNNLCNTAAANGNAVYCWADQSGNGANVTQATLANRPLYYTTTAANLINGQPTIRFDGAAAPNGDHFNVPLSVIQGRTAFSFFTAFRWNAVSSWQRLWDFGLNTTRNGFVTASQGATPRFAITIGGGAAEQRLTFSSALPIASGQLLNVIWGPPNGTGWRNGANQASGAGYTLTPNSLGVPTYHYIGRSIYPDPYLNANIGEFIVYSSALNDTNRILVDNYLSSKYNVALTANDVYAGDTAGNGNFDFDVAGIGQLDDAQHTQSHAAGIIVVNNTFLNANGDWLLFGHNVPTNSTTTADLPSSAWDSRWSRYWYMDLTDAGTTGGTVNIIFDYSDSGLGGTPAYPLGVYRLLRRTGTSGAFSDVTAASGATVSIVGDQVQFLGVDVSLLDGQTFTLGVADITPPTVGIVVADTALTAGETSLVTFTFSEAVTGFTNADLTIANGTLSAVSSSDGGVTWTATLTPTVGITDATNVITLNNTGVADLAGNAGTGSTDSNNYAIDTAAPTLTSATSTTADGSYNVLDTINVTVNFSESISSAAGLAITLDTGAVVNTGALTNVSSYSGTYTVAAGQNSADLTVSGITGTITDAATNNTVNPTVPAGQNIANSKAIVVDTTNPVTTATPAGGTYSAAQSVTLACSDVGGTGCASTLYCLGAACVPATSYVGAININASNVLRFYSTDNAGNGEGVKTETYTIDTSAPVITSATSTMANGTYGVGATINITLNFSESISSAAGLAITLDTGAVINTGALANVTNYSGTYTVAAGENSADLTVTSITGTITDAAGNNTANPTVPAGQNIADSKAIVIDTTAPILTSFTRQIPATSPTNADTLVFRATFSVDVQNVDAADFAVTGTTATITGVAGVGAGPNYSVYDITVSGGDLADLNGTVGLDLSGTQNITDLVGNALPTAEPAPADDETYEVNNTAPLVVSTNLALAYADNGPSSFIVTFNKDVYNPAGDTDADDATNPDNYVVMEQGSVGGFQTTACNGIDAVQDTRITPSGVTYIPNTAIVNLGSALPVGTYRLFVCGTTSIVDLAGNPLNNGVDFTLDFVVNASASGGDGDGDGSRWNGANAQALPTTGFAPNVVTRLPEQPAELAYTKMSDLWLEIPSQKVKANIVGVPQSENVWDVKWLGNDAGWLNGTAFPSWEGNSVLTAHVMGADGLPGPFAKLQDLKYGERIIVHMLDQQYVFEVRNKRLVRPDSTAFAFEHLEDASYLTLITCSGYNEEKNTYSFRRIIRAVLVEVK